MDKVRLGFLKSMGGNLADGDGIWYPSNGELIITEPILYLVNSRGFDCKGVEISNFTERENKGVQPVPDGFPVVYKFNSSTRGASFHSTGKGVLWGQWEGVITWAPDYDKLLEMQKEHDAKQELSSGMKKIRSFALEPDTDIEELMINAKESKMNNVFTQEMKDAGDTASIGMEVKVLNKDGFEIEYGGRVIGQSVKVLSEPLPVRGSIRVQAVEFMGQCYCFRSSMLHPVKSKEELELEKAKANQIKEVAKFLRELAKSTGFNEAAKALQAKGMLSEIVLPLEDK